MTLTVSDIDSLVCWSQEETVLSMHHAQFNSGLRCEWMVRRINWSQMCEWFQSWWETLNLLSILQPLASLCVAIFVLVIRLIVPSPHNSVKSCRLTDGLYYLAVLVLLGTTRCLLLCWNIYVMCVTVLCLQRNAVIAHQFLSVVAYCKRWLCRLRSVKEPHTWFS